MNLKQIKEYIKENEKLYDKETIKKRLRNNGAKPEDIKKAYSIFSFPDIKTDSQSQKETLENIDELSTEIKDLFKDKNIIIAGFLIFFGFGTPILGIILGIIAFNLISKEKDTNTSIIKIIKTAAFASILFSLITTFGTFFLNNNNTEIIEYLISLKN